MLSEKPKTKWYFKNSALVVSFLTLGPFALPLLWSNPRFSRNAKIVWTIIICVITYFLVNILFASLKLISDSCNVVF